MKILPKLLLVVFVMITACSEDDDKKVKLSARELLIKYDWIVFTVQARVFSWF
jgi:thioredoxin-related protein